MTKANDLFAAQHALVIGGGGGIGSAVASALLTEGAQVGLLGRRRAPLNRLGRRFDAARVIVADITSDRELSVALRPYAAPGARLDVLVHAAGLYSAATLADTTSRDFDRLWATNVRAPFVATKALLPTLVRSSGQVVFINSSAGVEAQAGLGPYSAVEHALRALTNALRAEINSQGVRVVSVFPGRTATRMQARIAAARGVPYNPELLLQPADIANAVLACLALPRTAEVTDLHIRPMLKT